MSAGFVMPGYEFSHGLRGRNPGREGLLIIPQQKAGIPALGTDWRQTEGKVCCHAIILPKKGFKIIMSIHYQFERK